LEESLKTSQVGRLFVPTAFAGLTVGANYPEEKYIVFNFLFLFEMIDFELLFA
jgi:hypothetical protein